MNADVRRWASLVVPIARRHSLAPSLVLGLIEVESVGDPAAISRAGAVGLMQVMPAPLIAGRPTRVELLDPARNIETGCAILAANRARIGHQAGALAAYYGAADADGRPNATHDGSGADGWEYVRRVEAAALDYLDVDQWADADFQQYAPLGGGWREAAVNLRGVADDLVRRCRQVGAIVAGV